MFSLWLKSKIWALNLLEQILENPEAIPLVTLIVSIVAVFAGGISSDVNRVEYTWQWYVMWWKWLELAGLGLLFIFTRDYSDVRTSVISWRREAEQKLATAKQQLQEQQRNRLTEKAETTLEQFLLGRGVDALTAKQASEEVEKVLR